MFRIAGIEVNLTSDEDAIRNTLTTWIDLLATDAAEAPTPDAPTFTIHFTTVPDASIAPPSPTDLPYATYLYVSGFRSEQNRVVFRGTDNSVMTVDIAAGRAECRVPRSALDGPPWPLRDLTNAALTTLLRSRGHYPLHAAALTRGDDALLIVGPPMAGKTTLGLNFLRRGWSWVADDKVLLSRSPDGSVSASGLFRHSNVDPALAGWFPELAGVASRDPLYPHSRKRGIHLEEFYGDRPRTACRPNRILFPQVVDLGPTTVEPLDGTAAFVELLRQTPVENDVPAVRGNLDLLASLSRDARAFRVLMGRDLLEDACRLPELGSDLGLAVGPPLHGG